MEHMPAAGNSLEATLDDGRTFWLIVESTDGNAVTLGMPVGDVSWQLSRPGSAIFDVERLVAVGWRARGSWYSAPIREVRAGAEDAACCQVVFAEEPRPSNRRRFVRGAGGETVQLSDVSSGGETVLATGTLVNLSEGGLRCWLPDVEHAPAAEAFVRISLGDKAIKAAARLHTVRKLTRGHGIEATLIFSQLYEAEAQLIRKHIYESELAARRAMRDQA
jgi:hypothetical protein